jgi:hypothetical protein
MPGSLGTHDPARVLVAPLEIGDLGVEEGVVVEPEVLGDALAVLEDLRRVGVLLAGHVPGLFEQRHVDERRRVAHGARVPVPVPRAAEVAALLDDANVVDPRLLQPSAGDETGEPATDEGDGHVVGLRLPLGDRRVGIVQVMGQLILQLDVLVVAVRTEALRPLLCVLLLEGIEVDRRH